MGIYIPDKLIEELRNNPMDAWDLLEHDDAVTVKVPHGDLIDREEIEVLHYTDADGEHIETNATTVIKAEAE